MTPDDLRVSVNGTRYYIDPLPTCKIARATKDRWPSVTTVKKAWSKPFRKKLPSGEVVPLDAYWCAEYAVDNARTLRHMDYDEAVKTIATSSGRTLTKAANRGTAIHSVLETLAVNGDVDEDYLTDEARPFVAACRQLVADCEPKWLLSEVVIVNRGVGFAGTLDAIIEIDGKRYLVDWKTRGGPHGAYEEDAAQLGAYAMAEYFINADDKRERLPKVDGGLIVSLTAENGYKLFPIDLLEAANAFADMHECWRRRKQGTATARQAIGPELNLADTDLLSLSLMSRIANMRDNYPEALTTLAASWPEGIPTLKAGGHSMAQLREIARTVSAVEDKHQLPF
jgi:hypothetical protein